MVEGGRTPPLSAEELHGLGFKIALFPISALTAAAEAMRRVYRGLKESGTSPDLPRLPFDAMNTLLGFPEVWAFERRWQEIGMEDEDAPGGERRET